MCPAICISIHARMSTNTDTCLHTRTRTHVYTHACLAQNIDSASDRFSISLKQATSGAASPSATLRKLSVSRSNLKVVASELQVGDTVEVYGLKGAAQYNGRQGVIKVCMGGV